MRQRQPMPPAPPIYFPKVAQFCSAAIHINQPLLPRSIDIDHRRLFVSAVNFTAANRHYLQALRIDPHAARPQFRMDTMRDFHEWKQEMRAYDAALIELNLATPRQIRDANAAVRCETNERPRIVKHAGYA